MREENSADLLFLLTTMPSLISHAMISKGDKDRLIIHSINCLLYHLLGIHNLSLELRMSSIGIVMPCMIHTHSVRNEKVEVVYR